MSKNLTFPVDDYDWIRLSYFLGKKVTIRAGRIDKKKERVRDTDGHEVAEAYAQGGVKVKSRHYDISKFRIDKR